MRQRLAKWMMGRNGMDALNRLLSVLTLILLIVSMFVHGYAARILWSLAVVGLIVIYFRMLSRNVYRRLKCPSCRTRLRVPRGKGKINIVCRKCGTSFQRKT